MTVHRFPTRRALTGRSRFLKVQGWTIWQQDLDEWVVAKIDNDANYLTDVVVRTKREAVAYAASQTSPQASTGAEATTDYGGASNRQPPGTAWGREGYEVWVRFGPASL